jgi:hypothetical protein
VKLQVQQSSPTRPESEADRNPSDAVVQCALSTERPVTTTNPSGVRTRVEAYEPIHGVHTARWWHVGSHLAGQVEEQVVAFQWAQLVVQPVDVLAQVVDVVDERAVGSQLELVHHLLQLHQLRHVHRNLVWRRRVGRVQIHHRHGPTCAP